MDNPNASVSLRPLTPGAEFPVAAKGATPWYSIKGARTPRHPSQQETADLLEKIMEAQARGQRPFASFL
eukprot:scaffold598928_cov25-Prasinocladus_malaysianus.AAC.1